MPRRKQAVEPGGEWLSLKDAAAMLGVHPATLRVWADAGRIPSRRTAGGHRRFARRDLEAWLQAHGAEPGAAANGTDPGGDPPGPMVRADAWGDRPGFPGHLLSVVGGASGLHPGSGSEAPPGGGPALRRGGPGGRPEPGGPG
ncbi:MAG: hypothetical protein C4312_07200, partial [Thermoflexus sp.]